jgi:transposase, IS5 family
MIGHMKSEGRLRRNPLKGILGDEIHAVLCGIGHNLRMLKAFYSFFWFCLLQIFIALIPR